MLAALGHFRILTSALVRHHDDTMRTTVTLDPDVARMIDEEVHRQRKTFKQVVNEAIRRGLSSTGFRRSGKRHRVVAHHSKLRPGFDRASPNHLADELEDRAVLAKR
jgi:Arc/MetJ-type ribon-helix-helix transcriptional regulator